MNKKGVSIEAMTLQMLQGCDHVIQYIDTIYEEDDIYIVMEWFNGLTLKDYIHVRLRPISEKDVKNSIYKIAGVLYNCNQMNLIYGDTKLDNIMIDRIGNIKVIDFGCTRPINSVMNCYIGTPTYFSPEMFDKIFLPAYDVWGLGIITYYMACGSHPFIGYNEDIGNMGGIKSSILGTPLLFMHPVWKEWSDTGKQFIEELLDKDPLKRSNISYVYKHKWFDNIDTMDI
jgi:serine/threonine protein kinase